MSKQFYV